MNPYPDFPEYTPIDTSPPRGDGPKGLGWGGRRRGAGAPKGNLNRLKHGFDTNTVEKAAMLIVAFDDVRRLFEAIVTSTDRSRYRRLLGTARHNLRADSALEDSIKADVAIHLLHTLDQLDEALAIRAIFDEQSIQSSLTTSKLGPPRR